MSRFADSKRTTLLGDYIVYLDHSHTKMFIIIINLFRKKHEKNTNKRTI